MKSPPPDSAWRELARFDGLHQARAIATSVASMEFEVRLLDADGAEVRAELELAYDAPYILEVPASDWPPLAEVIDEIIAEQAEFDYFLAAWHDRSGRWHRVFLGGLIALVSVLAVLGVIRL